MYNSPIELVVTDIQNQILKKQDEEIYKAVLHYVPNVDKEELLRALRYDRGQYEKGYLDGKADAMASIVRCKDCKWCRYSKVHDVQWCDHESGLCDAIVGNEFCSYGERREGDA